MYVLALTALTGTCWMLLQDKRNAAMEGHGVATRHLVESAYGVLAHFDSLAGKGTLTRQEAQSAAIAAIKALRYEEKEYFWINDMHPKMVMHPARPELDGKDLSEAKDPNGKLLFVEFVQTVKKNGQGFVSYLWPKPGMDKPVPKISYVKGFAPWGWVIGSGVYVDDVDAQFRRDATLLGGVASAIAVILGVMFWLMARSITRPIKRAVQIADSVSAGDLSQEIEVTGGGESAQLIAALARMQTNLRERTEADRRSADEMARIRQALDVSALPMRIADEDGKIVYVNNKLRMVLQRDEAAFRREIPGFEAAKIDGGSIGMFYADPEAAIERLRKLEKTTTVALVLGGRDYAVTTTPVFCAEGKRLGTIGQWVDRTEQLAAEKELKEIVSAASAGDFSRRVSMENKDGFFLQLAQDLNGLLETSNTGLNEVSRVLGALANGDLTEKITNEYQGTFGKLKDDSNQTVENLTTIVNQIKEASETIDTASKEITQGNAELSARTEQQASSLEETASSMEELTRTVKQNAENARQANHLAVGASDVAVKGGDVVKQVVATMSGISESSKKIADIIGTIDGIAFQTNILALNAAVEAARAGEQGRGFAVVATEVRNLAQRSANAAKEIKSLIEDSVTRVETGNKLVNEAGQTMDEIVNSVKRVTDIMAEITAASQEQSSGIEQVNQAITQMDEVTQQNAALVEQAAAASESMQEQAGSLVNAVGQFKMANAGQVERRGPKRVVNVARLTASAAKAAKPAPKAEAKSLSAPARKVVGSDEDWQQF
jgi:methyl-accepting chemotaxis protein